jgi:CubicO group peptidase (beta-lactamase class C family)
MTLKRSLLFLLLLSLFPVACSDSTSTIEEPPEIDLPSMLSAFVDQEFVQTLHAIDPQELEVQISVSGLPDWLTFSPSENLLRGTPSETETGLYAVEVVADNGVLSTTVNVLIRVFRSSGESALQSRLDTAVNSTTPGLDGISVAVIDRNGEVLQAYSGASSSGFNPPAIRETSKFRVASVTKPMTTALVLKLVDDGHLNLDAYVDEYYETELPNADKITIRQLLSHTSGVFDHLNSSSFWSDPSFTPTKVWTVEELVDFAVRNGPEFTPGVAYEYSNTGFNVLSAIIEEVTGMDIEVAYEQLIFEPMELKSTVYDNFSTGTNTIPDLAQNSRTYEYHLTTVGAAGAVAATPEDVAHFGRNLYGGRYLSPELTEKLSENIGETVGGQNYGLGTRIWNIGGIPHHGHTGALMDYRNILMYIPQADLTIAMHTHDVHSNWFVLVDEIFDYAVQNFSDGLAKPIPFIYGAESREEAILDAASISN